MAEIIQGRQLIADCGLVDDYDVAVVEITSCQSVNPVTFGAKAALRQTRDTDLEGVFGGKMLDLREG